MNLKLASSIVIAALLNTNTFAVEIYKGQIISHKEWSTGNNQYSFDDAKNHFPLTSLPTHTNNNSYTYYDSQAIGLSFTGLVNMPIKINGYNYTAIENYTTATQTYLYHVEDCAVIDSHTSNCAYYDDQIQLDPEGYIIYQQSPSLITTFSTKGIYQNVVTTIVNGSDNSSSTSTASSSIQIL